MRKISFLLASVGALLLIAASLPWPNNNRQFGTAPTMIPTPDLAAQGAVLFRAKGCAGCHRHQAINVQSARVGPDLTNYGGDPAFLRQWLADPASLRPNTLMPDLDLDPAEIEALIAFLGSRSRDSKTSPKGMKFKSSPPIRFLGRSSDAPRDQAGDEAKYPAGFVSDVAALNEFLETCPVTYPPDPPFRPPPPYPESAPYEGDYWYGDEALWTALPVDGRWDQLAHGEKVWWWREGYSMSKEPQPELWVTARRLDGEAPDVQSGPPATNGYHRDFHSAMLIGLTVPTPGCWEITGHYHGERLSFVVLVAP